jgi:adenylylsulfate kinase
MDRKSPNVHWHQGILNRTDRRKILGHGSGVIWFTGLSGSGKSTIANEVERRLMDRGVHSYVLDGDNIRHGLNADLEFSEHDRTENIRRIGEVSRLFVDAGLVVLTAFISPFRKDRGTARSLFDPGEFFEVYTKCSLELCEIRDTKGLYAKARSGEIAEFTGIDSPYEEPENPELVLDTEALSLEDCIRNVMELLEKSGIILQKVEGE